VIGHLAGDVRALRYDVRGHGLSDAPPAPYTMDEHVADLAALLDAYAIEGATVIGLSVGGMIAQALAAKRPDLARQLVLCDTAHKIGTEESWTARIDAVRKDGIAAIADAVLERWFSAEYRRARTADLVGYRNMLTRTPVEGYVGTCMTLRDTDLTATTSRLAQPTLCLVGEEDGATPPALVKSLSELIPNAGFKTVPSAGHLPCLEQPKLLAEWIEAFVRRNSGA
jgi:3-oxoadipate enol-lactonase